MTTVDVTGCHLQQTGKNTEFESLSDYLLIATKLVKTIAPRMGGYQLCSTILKSEDYMASIAYAIMIADWKYNGMGTKEGWRKQNAEWAIMDIISRRNNNVRRNDASLDYETEHGSIANLFSTGDPTPDVELENQERDSIINDMLNSGVLTDKQKHCIEEHYFGNQSYESIGKTLGITREAVRQNIQRGLAQLKDIYDFSGITDD